MTVDVLIYDRLAHANNAFTYRTMRERGVGGSEIEMLQVARVLTDRGYSVAVANGVTDVVREDGITYVPNAKPADYVPTKALYLQRMSTVLGTVAISSKVRIVVRANDIYCPPYDVHRGILTSGQAALVVNTEWQGRGFDFAREKIVIPPMLDASPRAVWPGTARPDGDVVCKVPGLFVYASGPMKGLDATLAMWRRLHDLNKASGALAKARLAIVSPGWGDFPTLSPADRAIGISFEGVPTPAKYREWIARAEGLFFVNTMPETFCCSAALAERSGTRTHILCVAGLAGIPEAIVNHSLLTEDPSEFADKFMEALTSTEKRDRWYATSVPDRRPVALVDAWIDALRITRGSVAVPVRVTRGSAALPPPNDVESGAPRIATLYCPDCLKIFVGVSIDSELRLCRSCGKSVTLQHGLPARAGTHIGHYVNTLLPAHLQQGQYGSAQRYWVHDRVLVGGSILDLADADRLRALGATHVLSAESERDDAGKWSDDSRARFDWPDSGAEIADSVLHKAFDYVESVLSDPRTVLYAHCQMGGSRGPTLGYIALRVAFGYSPEAAMQAIRCVWAGNNKQRDPDWVPHLLYIRCVERAIDTRPSAAGAQTLVPAGQFSPVIDKRVLDAYRHTPRFGWVSRALGMTTHSVEESMAQEVLPENTVPLPDGFGGYLSMLRGALAVGGSEYGLGLMLTSIVASIRATRVVEIGRFRGFSTLAIASGLALADAGWREPTASRQRPDVNYAALLAAKKRSVVSIDPHPTAEADALLREAGLERYVEKLDVASDDVELSKLGAVDMLLVDGSHDLDQIRKDVARFVPHVRTGGYFILHDYYGWFDPAGQNGSPVKDVVDNDLRGFERILIDTGFSSFVVFRKNVDLLPQPKRVPPRADGRPTVGLVLICKGDEGATIIARAIVSAMRTVDAVTVVADGGPQTVEVCRALGADVYLRKTPEMNWETGVGLFAAARNEALEIAERKTDFCIMCDPDDYFDGELPNELPADLYEMQIHDAGLLYQRAQMFRSSKHFRYSGIIHEYVITPPNIAVGRLASLKYIRGSGGHQDQQPREIKYGRHAKWLERWLLDHPDDVRSQFYLGQSYRDGGQPDKAIAAYEKRIEMTDGNDEERAFCALQIARIERDRGKDPTAAYLRAYEMRPTRAEPLCELAMWLRDDKQRRFALAVIVARQAVSIPMPADSLFLEPSVYTYRSMEELAIALYWSGDKRGARDTYRAILDRVPETYKQYIQRMIAVICQELGE